MESLTLYFNELCVADGLCDIENEHQWISGVEEFVLTMETVLGLRPDCKIAFLPSQLNADCGGRSLLERLRQCFSHSKDRYRRFLSRIRPLSEGDATAAMEREVKAQGQCALGLTLADYVASEWGHGWAVSLPVHSMLWVHHTLDAYRYSLNSDGELIGPEKCSVDHLSKKSHVEYWQVDLHSWGSLVATTRILAEIDGHPVVMYSAPREHNPPHVHLIQSRESRNTLAKYRIDSFVREKGLPNWDAEMGRWVNANREQLLKSWENCQRRGMPYKLQ